MTQVNHILISTDDSVIRSRTFAVLTYTTCEMSLQFGASGALRVVWWRDFASVRTRHGGRDANGPSFILKVVRWLVTLTHMFARLFVGTPLEPCQCNGVDEDDVP